MSIRPSEISSSPGTLWHHIDLARISSWARRRCWFSTPAPALAQKSVRSNHRDSTKNPGCRGRYFSPLPGLRKSNYLASPGL